MPLKLLLHVKQARWYDCHVLTLVLD